MNPVVKQVLEIAGLAIIVYAVWQVSPLVGLVVLGLALILVANYW